MERTKGGEERGNNRIEEVQVVEEVEEEVGENVCDVC